jgi:hypothetical protein
MVLHIVLSHFKGQTLALWCLVGDCASLYWIGRPEWFQSLGQKTLADHYMVVPV